VTDYVVRAARSEEELRIANEMMAISAQPSHSAAVQWRERVCEGNPYDRRNQTHIALKGSQVAGALRIEVETLRLGEARLKTGGIGWITVRDSDRTAMRPLAEYACALLKARQCHLAALFTADAFAAPPQFVPIYNEHVYKVDTLCALSGGEAPYRTRKAKPGDIATMQRIHNSSDQVVAASLIRTAAQYTNRWDLWQSAHVLFDEQGQAVAYYLAAAKDGLLEVSEVACRNDEVLPALLQEIAREAWEASCHTLHFLLPPNHPFTETIQALGPQGLLGETVLPAGYLALLNVGELFESLEAEWESLLQASPLREKRTVLCLLIDGKPWRIQCHHGAISVLPGTARHGVAVTSKALLTLVMGRDTGLAYLGRERRWLPQPQSHLFQVLFPLRHPYAWRADRF